MAEKLKTGSTVAEQSISSLPLMGSVKSQIQAVPLPRRLGRGAAIRVTLLVLVGLVLPVFLENFYVFQLLSLIHI